MIASSTPTATHSAPQVLQNPLTAGAQATEVAQVATALIPQAAIEEFALRFNVAMLEMLAAQGGSNVSPLSKKLRAYNSAGIAPVKTTSRFV